MTAATTSAACGWPPRRSAGQRTATRGHQPRPRTAATAGIGFSSLRRAHRLRERKFLAARGSRFGAHECVTLRANRSGSIDLYTGRLEHRAGQRDGVRPDVRGVLRLRLRAGPGARRRHRGLAAQHRLVRLAHGDRRGRRAAGGRRAAARQDAAHRRAHARRRRPADPRHRRATVAAPRGPHPRGAAGRACSSGPSSARGCPPGERPGLDETAYFEPPGRPTRSARPRPSSRSMRSPASSTWSAS